MARVITFSRKHPYSKEDTFFVEKLLNTIGIDYGSDEYKRLVLSLNPDIPLSQLDQFWRYLMSLRGIKDKAHTVRKGNRFKAGDWFSPRVWGNDVNPRSGRSGPYHSKQIIIAPDIQIKKTWDFHVATNGIMSIADPGEQLKEVSDDSVVAKNDGLEYNDFFNWIAMPYYHKKKDSGPMQIICWSDTVNY